MIFNIFTEIRQTFGHIVDHPSKSDWIYFCASCSGIRVCIMTSFIRQLVLQMFYNYMTWRRAHLADGEVHLHL